MRHFGVFFVKVGAVLVISHFFALLTDMYGLRREKLISWTFYTNQDWIKMWRQLRDCLLRVPGQYWHLDILENPLICCLIEIQIRSSILYLVCLISTNKCKRLFWKITLDYWPSAVTFKSLRWSLEASPWCLDFRLTVSPCLYSMC